MARKIGPYSRAIGLASMDGRSLEARLLNETKRMLTAHCGGKPSPVPRLMIERAAVLRLRLKLLEGKLLSDSHSQRDEDSFHEWSTTLCRILRDLWMKAAEAGPRGLAEHIASRRAS